MSIVHALFVPQGSLTKSGFIVAAGLLIAVGVLQNVVGVAAPALGPLMFFVGLVTAYCWVAVWIKRFHEGGMSGWWTILVVLAWLIMQTVAFFVALAAAGLDMSIFMGGDQAAIEAAMEPAQIPVAIASTVVSVVVAFGLNAILPAGKAASRDGGSGDGSAGGPDAGTADTPTET